MPACSIDKCLKKKTTFFIKYQPKLHSGRTKEEITEEHFILILG